MAHKVLVVGNFPTTSITGHQVQTVSGYDEAIEILTKENFDYIIIDAVIGTTNGHQLLKFIMENTCTPTMIRHDANTVTITTPSGEEKDWHIGISLRALFKFASFCNRTEVDEEGFTHDWLHTAPKVRTQRCA